MGNRRRMLRHKLAEAVAEGRLYEITAHLTWLERLLPLKRTDYCW